MAKAIAGTALIAGAIALTVASGGVGGVAAIAAVGTLSASLFAGAVVGAALLGAALDMSSIADALTNTVTTPQTVRSPAAPWQVIYGNVRTGGAQIDINSYGDNFKYCDQVIALACHPCVGVQQHTETVGSTVFPSYGGLYINGQGMQWRNNAEGGSGVPGSAGYDINGTPFGFTTSNDIQDLNQNHYSTGTHVYMEAYNGTGKSYQNGSLVSNQVSQFYISNGPSGHWDSTCTMMIDPAGAHSADGQPKGFTYVYLRLLYASNLWAGGIPQSLRFDVQGKSDIWDPRLSGGAGGYAYTNNAALIIADYMTNPYFGMGYKMSDFDADALIAAANLCDVAIPLAAGGTIAQYTINGTFTTNENPGSILKNMLAACDGDLSEVGGKWFIFPGAYVYPTATIDNSMMLGPIQVKTGKRGRDLINAVKGTFVCPAAIDTLGSPHIFYNEQPSVFNGQWQKQAFPPYAMDTQHGYSSDVWLAADGQKLYLELDFPFTTSAASCQRLAKQALLKNRTGNGLEDSLNKGLSFTVECNMRAYDIVKHDTVWVNYPRFNWTAPASGFSVPTDTIPDYTYTEFEVIGTKFTVKEEDGKPPVPVYELTLRATSPDIYLWNGSDELTMTDNKYPQFANTMQIAGPTSLTATSGGAHAVANPDGTTIDGILAQWTPPADGYVLNGGELVVQIMPVVSPTQTYTSTPITGGGVSNLITLSGSTNPFVAGESIFLGGAGIGGVNWTGTVLSPSGMTLTLVDAPPTAVTGGSILAAGWQTVAKLDGSSNQYWIIGLVDGEEYYVQVYAQNSAGITSTPVIAGPVTATAGTSTPGLLPYRILPDPIRVQILADGTLNGNILLQNPNFAGGDGGWTFAGPCSIVSGTPAVPGSSFVGQFFSATAVNGSLSNNQSIPCSAGAVLSMAAYIAGASGATGVFQVELVFYNSSGTALTDVFGNAVTPGAGWIQSRVVGTAPANTAYAQAAINSYNGVTTNASGAWKFCGASASLQANSMAEVPDGGGRFAAIEETSDQTINHFQTIQGIFPASSVTVPVGGSVIIASINIDISSTEDIITIWANLAPPSGGGSGPLSANVDGFTSFGLALNDFFSFLMGSISGLSPGAHTVNLVLGNYLPSASITALANSGTAMIQQICSQAGGLNTAPAGGRVVLRPAFV